MREPSRFLARPRLRQGPEDGKRIRFRVANNGTASARSTVPAFDLFQQLDPSSSQCETSPSSELEDDAHE